MIILGIDPGTTTVGFALIKKENGKQELLNFGVISTTPKMDLSIKLLEIGNDMKEIFSNYKPDIIVIEKLFFQNNTKTAIDVAQARGVVMYEAVRHNIAISEYTPLQVKKAITGNGKADKMQVKRAIQMLFGLEQLPKYDDAADAIAMAYMGLLNMNNMQVFR